MAGARHDGRLHLGTRFDLLPWAGIDQRLVRVALPAQDAEGGWQVGGHERFFREHRAVKLFCPPTNRKRDGHGALVRLLLLHVVVGVET